MEWKFTFWFGNLYKHLGEKPPLADTHKYEANPLKNGTQASSKVNVDDSKIIASDSANDVGLECQI